jgi:alpha-glucosidase
MLAFTRRCLELRSGSPALRLGSMTVTEAGDQMLRFERAHDGERLLCSFNLSERPVAFEASGSILLSSGDESAGSLGAYSAIIEDIG